MIDFNNDFYKNPGKFIYECQNVSFDNFDSSRKEFVKSKLRHNSYTDLKYFRGISDMTQFYKLCEWDYLYDGIDEEVPLRRKYELYKKCVNRTFN